MLTCKLLSMQYSGIRCKFSDIPTQKVSWTIGLQSHRQAGAVYPIQQLGDYRSLRGSDLRRTYGQLPCRCVTGKQPQVSILNGKYLCPKIFSRAFSLHERTTGSFQWEDDAPVISIERKLVFALSFRNTLKWDYTHIFLTLLPQVLIHIKDLLILTTLLWLRHF